MIIFKICLQIKNYFVVIVWFIMRVSVRIWARFMVMFKVRERACIRL